ncbi:MAG: ABC transporter ATP-binding protein [Erysipelotrichaceae bacterium]|nr:ABC transporter ATP-binding protein [Erysipelotrichaceae bacterium]
MKETAISIQHVCKMYHLYEKPLDRLKESLHLTRKQLSKEFHALQDINLDIYQGETIGIVGTNGSGKSTLLKIITGVLSATEGDVSVNGRISALLELGAGFHMEYTGMENIYLNGTMMGYTKEEIDEKVPKILEFADIGTFIDHPVKTYSSGMFVRLAFAVNINIDPEILIVDEALSVGDVFFQTKCFKKFDEFKAQGKTILLVTHDLSCVLRYCDRAVLLNKGQLLEVGSPKSVVDSYKKILARGSKEHKFQLNHESSQLGKNKLKLNTDTIAYGDGKAVIHDFYIKDGNSKITNTILKGETFVIGIQFSFEENLHDPLIAFTIKDHRGNEITGTNTRIEQVDLAQLKQHTVYTIEFEQEMNLQGGTYLLSLGCTGFENDALAVYHRLYDVTSIDVISQKDSVGYYDMNSKVRLVKTEE